PSPRFAKCPRQSFAQVLPGESTAPQQEPPGDKRMTKKILLGLLALAVLLAAALGINTWRKGSRQLVVEPISRQVIDDAAVAERLAEAVRLRTESSRDDPAANTDQFLQFHAVLEQRFPLVHARLQREVVGELSLLYTWPGSDPQAAP